MANKGQRINAKGLERCGVRRCTKPYCAKGLCRLHYERDRRAKIGMVPRLDRKRKVK